MFEKLFLLEEETYVSVNHHITIQYYAFLLFSHAYCTTLGTGYLVFRVFEFVLNVTLCYI